MSRCGYGLSLTCLPHILVYSCIQTSVRQRPGVHDFGCVHPFRPAGLVRSIRSMLSTRVEHGLLHVGVRANAGRPDHVQGGDHDDDYGMVEMCDCFMISYGLTGTDNHHSDHIERTRRIRSSQSTQDDTRLTQYPATYFVRFQISYEIQHSFKSFQKSTKTWTTYIQSICAHRHGILRLRHVLQYHSNVYEWVEWIRYFGAVKLALYGTQNDESPFTVGIGAYWFMCCTLVARRAMRTFTCSSIKLCARMYGTRLGLGQGGHLYGSWII